MSQGAIIMAKENEIYSQAEVLTTKEVMDRLKITRPTAIKLLKQGKLKAIKIGRDYRFIKETVDSFIHGESE